MDKYPRSGPLFDAISEIYLRENLYDQSRTMSEVVKDAAKKYKVPIEQLKNVLPNANEAFEGGSLPPPKAELASARKLTGLPEVIEKYKMPDFKSFDNGERLKLPDRNFAQEFEKGMVRANVAKAGSVLGKVAGPAVAITQAGLGYQDFLDKLKAGASYKEAATDPDLVKGLARGVLGYAGGNEGGAVGAMVPGGIGAKAIGTLVGSVAGAYGGIKLADMLTGNPTIDKIITEQHKKAKNERIQSEEYLKSPRLADAAPKDMELRDSKVAENYLRDLESDKAKKLGTASLRNFAIQSGDAGNLEETVSDDLVQKQRDMQDRQRLDMYDTMVRARRERARDSALKAIGQ